MSLAVPSEVLTDSSSAINRLVEDDGGFLYDPGFAFDADGNMYDIPAAVAPKTPPSAGIVANPVGRTREASDTSAYARVRRDHEEAGRIDLNVCLGNSRGGTKLIHIG